MFQNRQDKLQEMDNILTVGCINSENLNRENPKRL